MSTQKETVEFILEKLGEPKRFAVRAMFGEYALYADGKVVGLVCDDQLYVKILPESAELERVCEKDEAYPGSKLYYVVEEVQLSQIKNLPDILLNIAASLPAKKKKVKKNENAGFIGILMLLIGLTILIFLMTKSITGLGGGETNTGGLAHIEAAKNTKNLIEKDSARTNQELK